MAVCTKNASLKRSTSFDVFLKKLGDIFWNFLLKILVKTLKDGSLHKKLLVFKKLTSFDGFSKNTILFATFSLKFGQNPKTW